ncbi:MAG: DNA polymerase IV [Gemmatimonadales bacterium]
MSPPRILLADCDQMFVAVARLADPEGAGRAELLVVGGRAESRGVVCSASYEVRAFGVRSGMSIARAARLCPKATFVPVPRGACVAKSREVRAALAEWTPVVEPASIDEFYLDLSGTEALYRHEPLEQTAARLRDAVRERTGLSVSIGGGTNRLVAKLAVERAKPRPGTRGTGVRIVPPGGEAEFLAGHQLGELPGVGPRLQQVLARYGLISVRDALAIDEESLKTWLGPRTGEWLFARIRGRGRARVEGRAAPQSMSREETFPRDIAEQDGLETELLRLTVRLAADLRESGLRARCVSVKLRDHDFQTSQTSRTLPEGIASDRALYLVAKELLAIVRTKRPAPARLLGIALSRFEEGPLEAQLDLIAPAATPIESPRDRAVAQVMDRVNARYGRHALEPARLRRPNHRDDRQIT